MTVYVDTGAYRYGRMVMCHMIADTPAELAAMVDQIGVSRRWFQDQGSTPHFDIAKTKRHLAIAAGAVVLDRREFVEAMRRVRLGWPNDGKGRWLLSEASNG